MANLFVPPALVDNSEHQELSDASEPHESRSTDGQSHGVVEARGIECREPNGQGDTGHPKRRWPKTGFPDRRIDFVHKRHLLAPITRSDDFSNMMTLNCGAIAVTLQ